MKTGLLTSTATENLMMINLTADDDNLKSTNRSEVADILHVLESTQLHDNCPSDLVDTRTAIASLVTSLSDLPTHPPSLYVDIEGINLSRHGSISILQIHVHPTNETYLVDVHTLKDEAFSTSASNGHTLKSILESEEIPKAFFDIRNDSDALYSLYGIKVANIWDI
jgi:exonuclease 3'-5' domain-containing protein 1